MRSPLQPAWSWPGAGRPGTACPGSRAATTRCPFIGAMPLPAPDRLPRGLATARVTAAPRLPILLHDARLLRVTRGASAPHPLVSDPAELGCEGARARR